MAKRRPRIDDIAVRAGVSKGAVSFALNGRPGVSEETRRRILEIAAELDWHPNSAARNLGRSKTDVVGLVIARPARTLSVEPFFALLTSGIQAALAQSGLGLQMQIVEDVAAEIGVHRRWWNERRVDGLILIDLQVDDARIPVLEELGVPAVVVGGPGRHGTVASVWADDRKAMTTILDHLLELGHERIAHVAGPPQFLHTQRRHEAVTAVAQRLGSATVTTVNTDFSDGEGAAATRQLLAAPVPPTAIVFDSDVMALAGLGVARELGLDVPRDLSIVAFDDSILTRLTHPSITALSRDTFDFGFQVASALIDQLDGGAPVLEREQVTPQLAVRQSTAPPARTT
ncbi:LacI family DNA-binding transcriptional regulator [Pseudonocardia sp. GCM10023141]|uniref:LacI family DNA-binding transcriptional regulator n=1 Tax=Pseudonocardia sp. GCM10023141 TaxID=3252653 RepID=UPI003623A706